MLIKRAYEYLDRVTPLKYDCGRLCGKACCKGEGEIWLLPNELKLFEAKDGFEIKHFEGEYNLKCTALCDKDRTVRPFCCRIFPYFPIVQKAGDRLKIRLICDPRGTSFCPMARGEVKCTPDFARAVRKAVRLLCTEKEYFEFFLRQGQVLDEILDFRQKLLKE